MICTFFIIFLPPPPPLPFFCQPCFKSCLSSLHKKKKGKYEIRKTQQTNLKHKMATFFHREYAEREGIVISPNNNTNTTSCSRSQELPTTTTTTSTPPPPSQPRSASSSSRSASTTQSESSSSSRTKLAQAVLSTNEDEQTHLPPAAVADNATNAGPDLFSCSSGQYIRP